MTPATSTRDRVKRGKETLVSPSTKDTGTKRTKRVTRSQSQGLDDDHEPAPPNRPNTRQGRQPSVELGGAKQDSGAENTKRGGGNKRKRQQSLSSELPTVSEEPTRKSPRRDSQDSIPETCDNQQFAQETADDHANISGTTILANDSFDGSESLDPSLMLEFLPDLLQASTNLLSILSPSKLSESELYELVFRLGQGKLSTREQHRLSHRTSVFETNKKCFGNHNYIDIPSAIRAFTSNTQDIQRQNSCLESVLYKANLASLALSMAQLTDRRASGKFLLDLRSAFPLSFMSSTSKQEDTDSNTAENEFLGSTSELVLDIRTQYLILSLESQSTKNTFDSSISQTEVPSLPTDCTDQRLVKEWVSTHFQADLSAPLSDEFKDDMRQRTRIIRRSFSKDGETGQALNKLRETFPWRDFVAQLAVWVRQRAENIGPERHLQDSLDDMIDRLQQELDSQKLAGKPCEPSHPPQQEEGSVNDDRANGEMAAEANPPNLSDSEDSQRRTFNWAMLNASSMRLLKQRESKKGETSREVDLQAAALSRSRDAIPPSDGWVTSDGGSESESVQQPSRRNNLRAAAQKEKKENHRKPDTAKENARELGPAFIDAQEDARRVSPIGLEDSARKQNPRKRLAEVLDLEELRDDSESDGYQQDNRNIDIEQSRKRKPKGVVPSKKQRTSGAGESRKQRSNGHAEGRNNSPDADRHSVSSFPPDDPGDGRDGRDDREQSEEHGEGPITTEKKKAPKPQRRRRWTDDETRRLAKMIVKYGTSWALIKEKDEAMAERGGVPKLTERNQVQLKDKARNLVIEFYKNGKPLPKNFDQVTLSQKQKDKLAQAGIEGPWS